MDNKFGHIAVEFASWFNVSKIRLELAGKRGVRVEWHSEGKKYIIKSAHRPWVNVTEMD